MSTRIIDLPEAQYTNNDTVVVLVVPTILTVAGCTGGQAFFNGSYYMAADGFYYKNYDGFEYRTAPGHQVATDRPSLKKIRLPTHTQMQGPYGNQEEVIIYQDRYELHAPPNNPGGIPGGLWFRSSGYPSTPASVDSTYEQYNFDGGLAVDLPTITTNGSGVYNQTFKLPLSQILQSPTPWTQAIDADGYDLTNVYSLSVQNSINLQLGQPFRVGGLQVIGDQKAAIADATNLTDVVAQLNALLAALRTHGLIAT